MDDYCLAPTQQFFSFIIARTSYIQWHDDDEVWSVLDQRAWLDLYSGSSLKQQSAGKLVAPLRLIILIPSQPVFPLTACLAEKQHIPILKTLVWPDRNSNPRSTALESSALTIISSHRCGCDLQNYLYLLTHIDIIMKYNSINLLCLMKMVSSNF